ncbi:MAG: hypothetical protein IJC61_02615 [Oscillospiraceae bacterium]|nr:hypothetical protein [Oscillospiraceae bacterium]
MRGFCKYCGAVVEDLRWQTQEEANAAATEMCSCSEAVTAVTVQQCLHYISQRFPELEAGSFVQSILHDSMVGVALENVHSCTVQLSDGRKVRFTPGKDYGVVRVSVSRQSKVDEDARVRSRR